MNQTDNRERQAQLLNEIRAIDFALIETVLYLDAYPDHPQAMEYYHRLREQSEKLREQYQHRFGPLTGFENMSRNSWDWAKEAWPWEAEAN